MHDPVFVPSSAHTGIDMNAALLACLPGIRLLINSLKKKRGFSKQHDFVSHPRQVDSRNTAASKEKPTPPSSVVHETHMQTRVKITTTIQVHSYASDTSLSLKSIGGRGRRRAVLGRTSGREG